MGRLERLALMRTDASCKPHVHTEGQGDHFFLVSLFTAYTLQVKAASISSIFYHYLGLALPREWHSSFG